MAENEMPKKGSSVAQALGTLAAIVGFIVAFALVFPLAQKVGYFVAKFFDGK